MNFNITRCSVTGSTIFRVRAPTFVNYDLLNKRYYLNCAFGRDAVECEPEYILSVVVNVASTYMRCCMQSESQLVFDNANIFFS